MNKIGKKKILIFILICICTSMLVVGRSEAASSKYYIKVNKKTNVATVYKTKTKKAYKAFLVSCGKATPIGTFYTKNKYKWRPLMGNCYGQYATRITGSILFHSVWYYKNYDKSSLSIAEYNKLGTTASHGCVRLNVEDAKWIYDNCKLKTKVIIFNGSKKKDPLGKPKLKKISSKSKKGWDPTDPDKKNPYNKISYKGVSTKTKTLHVNSSINVLKGVIAKTKWGRNLTSKIKVTVKKPGDKTFKSTKVKTMKLTKKGTYQFKYSVKDSKTGVVKKSTVKYVCKDLKAATISGITASKKVEYNSVMDIKTKVTAKNATGKNLSNKVVISVKKPGSTKYTKITQSTITFDKLGQYGVEYKVTNPNNNKVTTKSVVYTCVDTKKPIIYGNSNVVIEKDVEFNVKEGITAKSVANEDLTNKITIIVLSPSGKQIQMSDNKFIADQIGEYIIKYKVYNSYGTSTEVTRKVTVLDNEQQ